MLTTQQIAEYNESGFFVLPALLDVSELEKARNDLEKYIRNTLPELNGRDINYADDGVVNSIHVMAGWEWTQRLQSSVSLRSIAGQLLGEEPDDFGAELFAKPARVGLPSPAHQDNFYWCLDDARGLTVWIALDDAGSENGGVYYYPGSQLWGLIDHTPSGAPGSSQMVKDSGLFSGREKVLPSINAGDCLIHHSLVVHGSQANTSERPRRGWTIRYKAKSTQVDPILQKQYEDALAAQISERENG